MEKPSQMRRSRSARGRKSTNRPRRTAPPGIPRRRSAKRTHPMRRGRAQRRTAKARTCPRVRRDVRSTSSPQVSRGCMPVEYIVAHQLICLSGQCSRWIGYSERVVACQGHSGCPAKVHIQQPFGYLVSMPLGSFRLLLHLPSTQVPTEYFLDNICSTSL